MNEKTLDLNTLKKLLNKKPYYPESKVPDYVIHTTRDIRGFFGRFRYLSNFYPCSLGIWYEGQKYPSTEHAYQSAKVKPDDRLPFTTCNVKEVKKLGGNVDLNKEEWDSIKYNIMLQLVTQKFSTHVELRDKLIATGNSYLEELNSWYDVYWGVDHKTGVGENKLGKILMTVRSFWKE